VPLAFVNVTLPVNVGEASGAKVLVTQVVDANVELAYEFDTLLLNVDQSVLERQPVWLPEATLQAKVPKVEDVEKVIGEVAVNIEKIVEEEKAHPLVNPREEVDTHTFFPPLVCKTFPVTIEVDAS
jgi:hypothetical protein